MPISLVPLPMVLVCLGIALFGGLCIGIPFFPWFINDQPRQRSFVPGSSAGPTETQTQPHTTIVIFEQFFRSQYFVLSNRVPHIPSRKVATSSYPKKLWRHQAWIIRQQAAPTSFPSLRYCYMHGLYQCLGRPRCNHKPQLPKWDDKIRPTVRSDRDSVSMRTRLRLFGEGSGRKRYAN